MNPDSRFEQIRQDIACAQASLDDARCAVAEIVDESPDFHALDASDFREIRSDINRALLKANSAHAAVARLINRAEREESRNARTSALIRGPW